jgi:hypothetical protein
MSYAPDVRRWSLFGEWKKKTLPDGREVWRQERPGPPIRGLLGIDAMGPVSAMNQQADLISDRQGSENPFGLPEQRGPRLSHASVSVRSENDPSNAVSLRPPGHGPQSKQLRPSVKRAPRSSAPTVKSTYQGPPYLSQVHSELLGLAAKYKPAAGTNEWDMGDFARWKVLGRNIHEFKEQWVRGYKDAINSAAARFDLPPALLAGVAYNEVGGDPLFIDDLAYMARNTNPNSPSCRDLTSFGNVSLEVTRASQALGYGPSNDLGETQRRAVIQSLKDPVSNIFVVAKHLSDLRDRDFYGVPGSKLTRRQVEILGARYNHGPGVPISVLQKDLSYGRAITKRWGVLNGLISERGSIARH